MAPALRKLTLTTHVVASVGWLGAVVVFLALSVGALLSTELETVKSAYIAMNSIGAYVLVPFSIASLLSGLVQGSVSRWGILRHYWVVAKLLINVVASAVLLAYTQTLSALAVAAATASDLDAIRSASPVIHAAGGLVLLLAAAFLSIYKPRGITRYGWRRQQEERRRLRDARSDPAQAA